ncbi:hypothetical protein [Myxococcus sp. AM010]|uniref:hypothetical protein n=1 Tax=Myxococcus sp. AM010 TaxID=2745138 RepID=UPI001595FF27|nr:hypothetical protein [Myxococcus sp. AM010]NVJ17879.1 hypothetical protein [Myxococcus sp. AM010]
MARLINDIIRREGPTVILSEQVSLCQQTSLSGTMSEQFTWRKVTSIFPSSGIGAGWGTSSPGVNTRSEQLATA